MNFRDLLKLALRAFRARKGRTVLTIVGMGIGIGAILFLVGMGYGLQRLLLEEITTSESLSTLDVAPNEKENVYLTYEKVKSISEMEGVVKAIPAFDAGAVVRFGETSTEGVVTIADSEFLVLDGKRISTGKVFASGDRDGLVMSSAFTKIFGESQENMLGHRVNLSLRIPRKTEEATSSESAGSRFRREQFEKIDLSTSFKISGFFESEELIVFAGPQCLGQDFKIERFSRLKVKSATGEILDELRQEISSQGYLVSSLSDTVSEVNRMFRGVKVVLAVFGMIALLVSAIGMFNTMTVALLERTKEIGVMKSIGASDWQILSMFILESTTMGFLGGITGIVFGVVSGLIFNAGLNLLAWRLGGRTVALFYFPLWFIFFIVGFSVLIGFLTGIIPARRASVLDPLEALRTK